MDDGRRHDPVGLAPAPEDLDEYARVVELLHSYAAEASGPPAWNRVEAMVEAAESRDRDMTEPLVLLGQGEIARFVDGTDLLAPGLVHINDWRPDKAMQPLLGIPAPIYGVVGRTP